MATIYRVCEPVYDIKSSGNQYKNTKINFVIAQPSENVWNFEHPWSANLCSCSQNIELCCRAFFCPCYFECQLFKRVGEKRYNCLFPCARFALRSKIRTAFRIQGNLSNDCIVTTCLPCCATIQMQRELQNQGF